MADVTGTKTKIKRLVKRAAGKACNVLLLNQRCCVQYKNWVMLTVVLNSIKWCGLT